jgi:DNA-directed RNA polymerase subunit RPC12/RpoP
MPTPRIAGYHFTCSQCGRRAFKDETGAPTPAAIAGLRQRARCKECGSSGELEIFRSDAWDPDQVERFKAHLAAIAQSERTPLN